MYRTTYADMSNGREVCVKSDFPSGYGGNIPRLKHNVLFTNTKFDRDLEVRRTTPRDAFPSFEPNINGFPGTTNFPKGPQNAPTHKTTHHNGTTTMPKFPWAV